MINHSTPLDPESESVVTAVIDAGFAVHRALGPGFLEGIYKTAMHLELDARNIPFECEKGVDVLYRDYRIPGQRVDLIVANLVLVELKAVKQLEGIHQAVLISYLKTTGLKVGLLMNFHSVLLKDGLKRIVL
jgi:GxxExxY protein